MDYRMAYETLKDLTESRLIRSSYSFRKYNLREIADLTFLYFLILQVLRSEYEFAPKARDYAKKTLTGSSSFENWRRNGTDLYMLLYMSNMLEHAEGWDSLKNKDANEILANRLDLKIGPVKHWLRTIDSEPDPRKDHRFLYGLENQLAVRNSGYKAVRRLVEDWENMDNHKRSLAVTRLLQAVRSDAPNSELKPYLERLSRKRRFEIRGVCNPETGKGCDPKQQKTPWGAMGVAALAGALTGRTLSQAKKRS